MNADRNGGTTFDKGPSTGRHVSPPPPSGLRHRPLTRAATIADVTQSLNRRRSSLFSENLSETRRSLRDSTDDLLHPRPGSSRDVADSDEHSHWHSIPLGLALLPALGGLFFQNGNALLTDVTLLCLAAVFLNWSIRIPWTWYQSARGVKAFVSYTPPTYDAVEEESDERAGGQASQDPTSSPSGAKSLAETQDMPKSSSKMDVAASNAQTELRVHELLALASCFIAPALGAWLLHAIRAQLSRKSEDLISNYNLTIFLLTTEIRPLSHLIKLIQARTLFLQKVVNDSNMPEPATANREAILDLNKRLEELEQHLATTVESSSKAPEPNQDMLLAKTTAQATSELRRGVQPELDALNRAVRRYEKRTTISSIQTEARLQEIESQLRDVVALAAAAQRNVRNQPTNFIIILTNWLCGVVVIPVQCISYLLNLPSRILKSAYGATARTLQFPRQRVLKDSKSSRPAVRPKERKIKKEG